MIHDWTEKAENADPDISQFTPREQELLKDCSLKKIRTYGRLDQYNLEAIIVGYLIAEPAIDKPEKSMANAVKICEAGIQKDHFEHADLAALFEDFVGYFRKTRQVCTIEDAYARCLNNGQDPNQASMYEKMATRCRAVALTRGLNVDLAIERITLHHRMKLQNAIIETAQKERSDPKIGPRKSLENMREACIRLLHDPREAAIRAYDFAETAPETMNWLKDLKHHPEKHRGAVCGITAIDMKTQGFRAGQLTTFVGSHGGFKTTTMMNVAYGLWERDQNVLYASLEMEAQIVQTKILCRGAKLSYSRLYGGNIIEPDDWNRLNLLAQDMADTRLPKEKQDLARREWEGLSAILAKRTPQEADVSVAEEFFRGAGQKKNRLVVVNVGQSQKMKLSQLERWLHEQSAVFKPDVIILDYLDLIAPEISNPDRVDIGFGDICKMSRAMGKNLGFSAITAAQMKRGAIERLRKTGLDQPEKAQFGTDDVSGSSMIGADSDNMFVLWRKGGNELLLFTVKSRYTGMDNTVGETLQVDHDTCTIGSKDQIETLERKTNEKTLADGYLSASKMTSPTYMTTPEDDDDYIPDCAPRGDDMDPFAGPKVAPDASDEIGDL